MESSVSLVNQRFNQNKNDKQETKAKILSREIGRQQILTCCQKLTPLRKSRAEKALKK